MLVGHASATPPPFCSVVDDRHIEYSLYLCKSFGFYISLAHHGNMVYEDKHIFGCGVN